MPNVPVGKQSDDGSRTPTLREFIRSGRDAPRNCWVRIVFKPNKTPAYGLVADAGFRVSVNPDSELYDAIDELLSEWISGDSFLVICPDISKPGRFSLEVDTNQNAKWDETSWGFILEPYKNEPRTRSKKKPTAVPTPSQEEDDVPMM